MVALLPACGGAASSAAPSSVAPANESEVSLDEPIPTFDVEGTAAAVLDRLGPATIDVSEPDALRELAAWSAPRVFFAGLLPLLAVSPNITDGDPTPRGDPTCPRVDHRERVVVYRGGCTDRAGTRWVGRAVVVGLSEDASAGDASFDDFGYEKRVECDDGEQPSRFVTRGRFEATATEDGTRFAIDLAFDASGRDDRCEPMSGRAAIEYAGEVRGRPGDRRTWSGRGRVGFPSQANSTGGSGRPRTPASRAAPPGLLEVATEAEELDRNVCRTEALAGTTTVRTAEHEVRFTYDGASDCDETSTALLAIDDIEQAPLTGVMCSTLRRTEEPSHTTTSTCLLVACLCLLRVARRRSEGRRGARTQRS